MYSWSEVKVDGIQLEEHIRHDLKSPVRKPQIRPPGEVSSGEMAPGYLSLRLIVAWWTVAV